MTHSPGQVGSYSAEPGAPSTRTFTPVDSESMNKFQIASIIGLCGFAAEEVASYALGYSLLNVHPVFSGFAPPLDLSILLTVVFAFTFVEIYLFRQSFRLLTPSEPRLRTPAELSIYALVGVLLIPAGLFGLYYGSMCAANTSSHLAGCAIAGYAVAALALAIGGVAVIIGYIAWLLGLWRVGTHYHERMFKIGMVLTVLPYLNVVGYILFIIASRKIGSEPALPDGRPTESEGE